MSRPNQPPHRSGGGRRSEPVDRGAAAAGVAPRRLALDLLGRIEEDGAWANLVVPRALDRCDLGDADRRLVTELTYGAVRQRRRLAAIVDPFLDRRPAEVAVRALHLGAYQLEAGFPDHAAVSTTVGAAPKKWRGLVNAVLRNIVRSDPPRWRSPGEELSYPDWIVDRLTADLGPEAAHDALIAMNQPVAPTKRADGYTQDRASTWVVEAVGAGPGDLVIDVCAAPGGKATGLAATGATVIAGDLLAHRAKLVVDNAARLHSAVHAVRADGTATPFRPGSARRVLVDAPCSGLGVMHRRADLRWRVEPGAPDDLAELQGRLLEAAAPLVTPGGSLTYSVCTLTRAEGAGVVERFLDAHPEFSPTPPPEGPWLEVGPVGVLLPQRAGTDGMALATLDRAPRR
ncbi:MAG: transcription antitermination factor NusB [Microthrixaceae bacterium]